MLNLGNIPASSVLYIPFATYGGTNGESITLTGLAVTDIEVYKNGSTTQRASDAGFALLDTDGIDFDGITGIHGFSIDLSDNTDSGFYAAGSTYWVVVSAVTVDAQTVNFVAAVFRIVAAENTAGTPAVDTVRISGDATAADNLEAAADGTGYNLGGGYVVSASVTGSIGSISGVTFPTNFSALGINGSGHVSRVVLCDTTTTNTDLVAAATIADAVWDEPTAGHVAAGSTGAAIIAAGSAGDPWSSTIPGAYGAGTAGYILGTNLDATISSRAPSATALSTAQWTNTRAGYLDNLSAGAVALASTALSTAQWTNTRAGYLDGLSAGVPTAAQNAAGLLDLADGVETGLTVRGALRLDTAALCGKASGMATTTAVLRAAVSDTKARITATVDADGNRSAVTTDAT